MNTINETDYKITGMNLWIFGYQKAAETLFELPGWPKSMQPELFNISDGRSDQRPSFFATITSAEKHEITAMDICDALNALRCHNCGYFAVFHQVVPQVKQRDHVVNAWLTSPEGIPMILRVRNTKWPQLVKRLIGGQWQEGRHLPEELQDLSGFKVIERAFTQYREHRVSCERARELNNILGG